MKVREQESFCTPVQEAKIKLVNELEAVSDINVWIVKV